MKSALHALIDISGSLAVVVLVFGTMTRRQRRGFIAMLDRCDGDE